MSRIRVIAAGLESSVQDLGRFGWAHFGVSASGAADPLALRAGNLLVGNAENATGVEMTLAGAELEFEATAVIALTGSDFGSGLPLWTPVEIAAGGRIRCPATRGGHAATCVSAGVLAFRRSWAAPRRIW
jgi:antagonist of KipI